MSIPYGTTGSPTFSTSVNTIDEILNFLPDNTINQITARNARDGFWSVWNRMNGLSQSVDSLLQGTVSAALVEYTNSLPSTIKFGDIPLGYTFSNFSLEDFYQSLFYQYTEPILNLTASTTIKEFGDTTGINLFWNVSKGKNTINTPRIFVPNPPNSVSLYNLSVSGTFSFGTISGVLPVQNVTTTFTFSLNDINFSDSSGTTYSKLLTVEWRNRIYWGTHPTFTLPNNTQILSLDGASVGTGNEFGTSYSQIRNGIDGNGNYLVFAWPSSFGAEPIFITNGMINTAFTRIGNSITFTNSFSYTASYDVWISDTPQNSPINLFQII